MGSTKDLFTEMEIDTIGEMLNISMGAAATAVSTLLNRKVYITVPKVEVTTSSEFEFKSLTPGVGVEINYIEGLSGVNVFLLKMQDVQKIVEILLQMEHDPDVEFVMDEISTSAICETMNQMMGSASTALAQFLNTTVNISTPTSFEVKADENFSLRYFQDSDDVIIVRFNLQVDGVLDSEFANVMPIDFARDLLDTLFGADQNQTFAQEPIRTNKEETVQAEPTPAPQAPTPPPPVQQPVAPPPQQPAPQAQPQHTPAPQANYNVAPASFQGFAGDASQISSETSENLKLIMSVPLKISVELGNSKKTIKDILEFSNGSIIELDKQAGMPVDILVNGQKIATGDVVVVEEYYGVRITEILNPSEIIKVL